MSALVTDRQTDVQTPALPMFTTHQSKGRNKPGGGVHTFNPRTQRKQRQVDLSEFETKTGLERVPG